MTDDIAEFNNLCLEISKALTEQINRLNKRIANLETQLAEIRASLVEFAKPPYKDSDPYSLLEWVNARAAKLIQDMDTTSDTLRRLYPYKGDL